MMMTMKNQEIWEILIQDFLAFKFYTKRMTMMKKKSKKKSSLLMMKKINLMLPPVIEKLFFCHIYS